MFRLNFLSLQNLPILVSISCPCRSYFHAWQYCQNKSWMERLKVKQWWQSFALFCNWSKTLTRFIFLLCSKAIWFVLRVYLILYDCPFLAILDDWKYYTVKSWTFQWQLSKHLRNSGLTPLMDLSICWRDSWRTTICAEGWYWYLNLTPA